MYASVLDDYENTEPWSRFGKIVALTEEEIATAVREVKEKGHEERAGAENPPTGELRGAFDLNGQRRSSMQRGLFILNGKKVVLK